jgi:DNA-binding CsgD family transcriptional regulator
VIAILLAPDDAFRQQLYRRLLEADCGDVRVAEAVDELANLLLEGDDALTVLGGRWPELRQFVRVAVSTKVPAVLVMEQQVTFDGENHRPEGSALLDEDVPGVEFRRDASARDRPVELRGGGSAMSDQPEVELRGGGSAMSDQPEVELRGGGSAMSDRPEVELRGGGSVMSDQPGAKFRRGASATWDRAGVEFRRGGNAMLDEHAREALDMGVCAVLRADISDSALKAALAASRAGLIVIDSGLGVPRESPNVDRSPQQSPSRTGVQPRQLTLRERKILSLIASGISNKGIARSLGVSVNTVKFHLTAAFQKLNATTRAEAVTEAIRRGELSL